MNPILEYHQQLNRRRLLQGSVSSIGVAALSALLAQDAKAGLPSANVGAPHFAPRAKRIVYLFQSGGPSHLELLDYKPKLKQC